VRKSCNMPFVLSMYLPNQKIVSATLLSICVYPLNFVESVMWWVTLPPGVLKVQECDATMMPEV
ncbi:MAG TPA: hypothetical protein VF610_03880, partial [Segetibacter sp.]